MTKPNTVCETPETCGLRNRVLELEHALADLIQDHYQFQVAEDLLKYRTLLDKDVHQIIDCQAADRG
jgi:hypothetical protein